MYYTGNWSSVLCLPVACCQGGRVPYAATSTGAAVPIVYGELRMGVWTFYTQ